MAGVPSIVKFWKLRHDKGLSLESYQRLAVAMAYEAGGCPSAPRAPR
jgi:hypothetical protein